MNPYLQNVLDQPEALREASVNYESQARQVVGALQARHGSPDLVVFTGMGSSYCAGRVAAHYLNHRGVRAVAVESSDLLYFDLNGITPRTWVILVSQSGESVEIRGLVDQLRGKAPVLGVANVPGSYLAASVEDRFLMGISPDHSIAVKTYTGSILALLEIAAAIAGDPAQVWRESFKAGLDAMEHYLNSWGTVMDEVFGVFQGSGHIMLLARGPSSATALEGALLLKEGAKVHAEAMNGGQFRHGSIEVVDEMFRGFVFSAAGTVGDLDQRLAQQIAQCGGTVALVSPATPGLDHPRVHHFALPRLNEFVSPLVQILPVQLLAYRLAESRSVTPGHFRNTTPTIRTE